MTLNIDDVQKMNSDVVEPNNDSVLPHVDAKKKKFFTIPVIMLLLGVIIVAAAGTYYYFYSETINVHGIINHPVLTNHTNVSLIVLGDLTPDLNCTVGYDCQTELINVTNPTLDAQNVVVAVNSVPTGIDAVLVSGDISADISVSSYQFNIDSNTTKRFRVIYQVSDNTTATSFDSIIHITSNMTEY
jgi:hypothetical protein